MGIGCFGWGVGVGKLSVVVVVCWWKVKVVVIVVIFVIIFVEGIDVESIVFFSLVSGEDKKFDFVEVMVCFGGCVNGGG